MLILSSPDAGVMTRSRGASSPPLLPAGQRRDMEGKTCSCGSEEVARLREELRITKANLDRALREVRDGEREYAALRRRLKEGGR